jgi:hypothetical protein
MRLDVFLTPGEISPSEITDRTVVVIDILRASTTIVEALSAGAKSIYPVASIEEALRLANTFGRDEVLLCGERRCLPIEGFDLGNSPREFTAERVAGKTLVMSTTNGTNVMSLTTGATRVYIASLLNLARWWTSWCRPRWTRWCSARVGKSSSRWRTPDLRRAARDPGDGAAPRRVGAQRRRACGRLAGARVRVRRNAVQPHRSRSQHQRCRAWRRSLLLRGWTSTTSSRSSTSGTSRWRLPRLALPRNCRTPS